MPRGGLGTRCDASARGVRVARWATVEASDRGGEGRFCARGGGRQAAGHEPRYPTPRLRCGLGCPHGSGFDVRHRPRLEPGDLAGRVLAGDRLDGVDQIRRATFDVRDAGVAKGVGIYAKANVVKGYAMLRIAAPITARIANTVRPICKQGWISRVCQFVHSAKAPCFFVRLPTRLLFKLASLPPCELTRARLRVVEPALAVQPRRRVRGVAGLLPAHLGRVPLRACDQARGTVDGSELGTGLVALIFAGKLPSGLISQEVARLGIVETRPCGSYAARSHSPGAAAASAERGPCTGVEASVPPGRCNGAASLLTGPFSGTASSSLGSRAEAWWPGTGAEEYSGGSWAER